MGRVLLDTTVLVDLLRGRAGTVERLRRLRADGDLPFLCAVSAEEIARGIRPREQDAARRLLTAVRAVPLGVTDGWVAGEWRREYARRGRTLAQADCLIAAAALALGGRLATGNPRDFPMPGLRVEHWPPGE